MKRLHNHFIGVDQGTCVLFSDFEDGGDMWVGKGSRSRRIYVEFEHIFKTLPAVHVSLDMWDMDQKTNQRADISSEEITKEGFYVVFKT